MPQRATSEPITISDERIAELDAHASATDRYRNDIIDQAIEQHLTANSWQTKRIQAGIDAVREGSFRTADVVFGWYCREAWLAALRRLVFAEPAAQANGNATEHD